MVVGWGDKYECRIMNAELIVNERVKAILYLGIWMNTFTKNVFVKLKTEKNPLIILIRNSTLMLK